MNEATPPPIPPQAPGLPPQPPVYVDMKPRWIAWVVASVIMPALAWLTLFGSKSSSGDGVLPLLGLAILLQLAASIAVAIGFSKKRSLGIGGAIGMTIVFMLASVAIGTAVSFAVCVTGGSMDFK